MKSHIEEIVLKNLKTPVACAQHIREMFAYNLKREYDPFLWCCWQVSNVPSGYKKLKKTKTGVEFGG